jgi:hypothetical protein
MIGSSGDLVIARDLAIGESGDDTAEIGEDAEEERCATASIECLGAGALPPCSSHELKELLAGIPERGMKVEATTDAASSSFSAVTEGV